jgi:hypothetical protein
MFFLLVLTHRYGRDGPESKKFDDKCLLFDFEFFQKINNSTFTDNYKKSLHKFSVLLENYRKSGKKQTFTIIKYCFNTPPPPLFFVFRFFKPLEHFKRKSVSPLCI